MKSSFGIGLVLIALATTTAATSAATPAQCVAAAAALQKATKFSDLARVLALAGKTPAEIKAISPEIKGEKFTQLKAELAADLAACKQ